VGYIQLRLHRIPPGKKTAEYYSVLRQPTISSKNRLYCWLQSHNSFVLPLQIPLSLPFQHIYMFISYKPY